MSFELFLENYQQQCMKLFPSMDRSFLQELCRPLRAETRERFIGDEDDFEVWAGIDREPVKVDEGGGETLSQSEPWQRISAHPGSSPGFFCESQARLSQQSGQEVIKV